MTNITYRQVSGTPPSLALHPVLEQVLHLRGIQSSEDLNFSLSQLVHFQHLKDIDKAVALLLPIVLEQKPILIVGDFDVDGACSVALVVQTLRAFGARHVHYLVPNRFEHGYGLSVAIVEQAKTFKPHLIMTVDNGISSFAGVHQAQAYGIKVLISDHHLPAATLPNANAIVNPNQPECKFPSKAACGCTVAFYIMLALRAKLEERNHFKQAVNMASCLDLLALATVADVMLLDKNNRILLTQGLQRIRAGKARAGIQALIQIAGRDAKQLTSSDLGFALGPRLNAAGRLDDMTLGIECLLSQSPTTAYSLAQTLDQLNQERRDIEHSMQQDAQLFLAQQKPSKQGAHFGLCLYEASWHQGVIGILASRIKEQTKCPVIAFAADDEGNLKGSARSIKGVHIRDVLETIAQQQPDLLSSFGGHAMAAGLSIKEHHYPAFKQAFESHCKAHIPPELLQQTHLIDAQLAAPHISYDLAKAIADFLPWGQGFNTPLFSANFTLLEHRLLGQKHLKVKLMPEQGTQPVEGIYFNIPTAKMPHKHAHIMLIFELDINYFRGHESMQLLIQDMLHL